MSAPQPGKSPKAAGLPRVDLLKQLFEGVDPALLGLRPAEWMDLLTKIAGAAQDGSADEREAASSRWQDETIEQHIPSHAAVLDLGCGDGHLLAGLIARKQVYGQGIELDSNAVFQSVAQGVPVFQANLDDGLKGFEDHSFDYVVLEETLQALHRPTAVLEEMLRVGRHGIISFPNFGYWRVRLELALRGRMPVTGVLPYRWYDTPNIHLLSLQDFVQWAGEHRVHIVEGHVLADGKVRRMQPEDNLYAEEVLFVIRRA